MNIKITKEFVEMIDSAAREWHTLKSHLDEKYHYFDFYANEYFGIQVDLAAFDTSVILQSATVIDSEKYVNFLLRYGKMPNE